MSREDRPLSTADFAATGEPPVQQQVRDAHPASPREREQAERRMQADASQPPASEPGAGAAVQAQAERLAALFPRDVAEDFRSRWSQVQIGFVDDPKQAVQQADELVAQVIKSLAQGFTQQRSSIESGLGAGGQDATENMRMALRQYRSFFDRLLSL